MAAAPADLVNHPASNAPYFTPAQTPPAGTAIVKDGGESIPKVFTPIKLRDLVLPNRIMLSPLCQYSAQDGHMTAWHETHLGGILQRGPGLTCFEATAVTANGRITPEDAGIWKDSQIEPMKKIVDFAHSQNQKVMLQLAHAGRKASTVAPWISFGHVAGTELNGWPDDVWAPSAIPFSDKFPVPKELSLDQIEQLKVDWVAAVKRALKAGFDVLEIHSAHGYLLHEFLSPVSNKRTDKYGGSFENRTRLLLEITELTRKNMPEGMPLVVRVSGTDWLENHPTIKESWTKEDTVRLAPLLAERGVDLLDVSSGGNTTEGKPTTGPAYQAPFALAVKKAVGDRMAVGSVGSINTGKIANDLLDQGLDIVAAGRWFQKNPGLVFAWADELNAKVQMPNQISWAFGGRGRNATDEKPLTTVLKEQGKL